MEESRNKKKPVLILCRHLFIDSEWKEPVKKNRIPVINLVTEKTIGDIPAATSEDVDIAVKATRRALKHNRGKDWASATRAHRAKYLCAIVAKDILAATSEDVDIAVKAARRALKHNKGKDWASATGAHLAKYLCAIATKITKKKDEFSKLEAIDSGKKLDEATWDIDDVAGCFKLDVDLAEALDAKQKTPIELQNGYI